VLNGWRAVYMQSQVRIEFMIGENDWNSPETVYDWNRDESGLTLEYLKSFKSEIQYSLDIIERRLGYPLICNISIYKDYIDLYVNKYYNFRTDEIIEVLKIKENAGFIEGYITGIIHSVNNKFRVLLETFNPPTKDECIPHIRIPYLELPIDYYIGDKFSFTVEKETICDTLEEFHISSIITKKDIENIEKSN